MLNVLITLVAVACLVTTYQVNAQPDSRLLDRPQVRIETDLAVYAPGKPVRFTLEGKLPVKTHVQYYHLNRIVGNHTLNDGQTSWTWVPPSTDFQGYLAEVFTQKQGKRQTLATIAIDVSSDWNRFPRYGFLASYPRLADSTIQSVIRNLNRYHINGIQFYDWHYKHHKLLPGGSSRSNESWVDIANRATSFNTVKTYIGAAHQRNMKALFYNLAYGALTDASADGVADEWYLYTDSTHTNKERFELPKPPFLSDIYFLDPANRGWQQYLAKQNTAVYSALPFDGFHIDQVGNRDKKLFDFGGRLIDLETRYNPFIQSMKAAHPDKRLVMNAVNQYGQQASIARSPVDFLYTEVWSPNERYEDLGRIIQDNDAFGNGSKRTVLAAYMDYKAAEQPGY
ncbi:glycoside hydrolase family 66 protein, partial [Spirosoma panaciterrae]|uniref:glycoside hydrolase family 66 protein n=1 Tax=Spirosoma panaciterrae TaxID=496058 RepID=UPI0003698BC2